MYRRIIGFGVGAAAVSLLLVLGALSRSSPTSAGGTPTPTPVPPADGLDFSIGVDITDGNNGGTCNSSATPTAVCNIHAGQDFTLRFYLDHLPTNLPMGYAGYLATVDDSELVTTLNGFDLSPWPGCSNPTSGSGPNYFHWECAQGPSSNSSYTGLMAKIRVGCSSDRVLTLANGELSGGTYIYGRADDYYVEAADESLTIHCISPQAYPVDTDGDGCPDAREEGINMMMGGRRNFLNPWDWWDPTGDHLDRIDDVLAVTSHYGKNEGDPGYDTKYDRTYLGPFQWNLGPPDGRVRIDDARLITRQYNSGCSAS